MKEGTHNGMLEEFTHDVSASFTFYSLLYGLVSLVWERPFQIKDV